MLSTKSAGSVAPRGGFFLSLHPSFYVRHHLRLLLLGSTDFSKISVTRRQQSEFLGIMKADFRELNGVCRSTVLVDD